MESADDEQKTENDLKSRLRVTALQIAYDPIGWRHQLGQITSGLEDGTMPKQVAITRLAELYRSVGFIESKCPQIPEDDVRVVIVGDLVVMTKELFSVAEDHHLPLAEHLRRSGKDNSPRSM